MTRVSRALRAVRARIGVPASPQARGAAAVAGDDARELLFASALFDDVWYSLCVGKTLTRRDAIEHYLSSKRIRGLSPHPLFEPVFTAVGLRLDMGRYRDEGQDVDNALVVYLRDRRFDVAFHPLFDLDLYLAEHPEATEHADGPLGHYLQIGAPAGARINSWYQPEPAIEPTGVAAPIVAAAQEWARRRLDLNVWGPPGAPAITKAAATPVADIGLTTIVLVVENPDADLSRSIESVLGQTTAEWELIIGAVGTDLSDPAVIPADSRIRVLPGVAATSWAVRNEGLALAQGRQVAWMSAGDSWFPGRLSALHRALLDSGSTWVHDAVQTERPGQRPRPMSRRMSRERLLAGAVGELSSVIVSTDAARAVGGFDESLPGGQALEMLLKLGTEGGFAPGLGVSMQLRKNRAWQPHPWDRPWVNYDRIASATDVVLNRHLVDWEALATTPVESDLVSVLIPTYEDWEMTELAVRRVVEARKPGLRVEIIVIDNGCGVVPATILSTLPSQYDGVQVVQTAVNHGFALGNNVGLNVARGATVVFLNNDTEVDGDWLEPLVEALRDPEILGAQSLLIYPDGTIQSAGVVFPRGSGLPHVLLQNFPVEDAVGLESYPLHALTGAALAMRFSDVVALRGFDPIFRNGMEDVDICLRLAQLRSGRFAVIPESRVIHHESKTPGRFSKYLANRQVLLDRWIGRLPEDDVEAWGNRGFQVAGHRFGHGGIADRRLLVAEPVLTRRLRPEIIEGVPVLRWAIKNPAPSGPKGDVWGDTHFADQLARALRKLGQEVVVDRRGAFERPSESLDDVVLLLQGLGRYTPLLDRVNLTWLISHPDLVERTSHHGWDRIYVASAPFADRMASEWGAPAVPLLQATDPAVFHPGLAEPDSGEQVLFIGNSRGQARPLVMAAIEADLPLRVYGAGWEDLIPERYIAGQFIPNDQVGAAYRAARVVLNDHWEDMAREGFLSNRLFDAVAAGARVISDEVPSLHEVFGDAVQVASTSQELAAIVNAPDLDALFGSDDVRRARATDIAAHHCFDVRAKVMLDDALQIRAERGYS